MKIFKGLYCYAYIHSEKTNEGDPRSSGTIMVSVMLLMWVLSIFFLTIPFSLGEVLIDLLQDLFGYRSGKTIGQVLGLSIFVIIYPIVRFTMGSKSKYANMESEFTNMDKENCEELGGAGLSALIITIVVFVLSVLIGGIGSMLV